MGECGVCDTGELTFCYGIKIVYFSILRGIFLPGAGRQLFFHLCFQVFRFFPGGFLCFVIVPIFSPLRDRTRSGEKENLKKNEGEIMSSRRGVIH